MCHMPISRHEPVVQLLVAARHSRWYDVFVAGLFLAGSGCFLAATRVDLRTLLLPSLGFGLFITGGAVYIRVRYQEPYAPGGLTPITVFLVVSSWLAVADAMGSLRWWLWGGILAAVVSRAVTSLRTRKHLSDANRA
jgi:hypothetical protein